MPPRSLSREQLPIKSEDDVVLVRRRVRQLAEERRFDPFAAAAVTTATSELARNVWVHAKGGHAEIEELQLDERLGLRVSFFDEGPGILDVDRVLKGGFSTASSLGLGLSGAKRLVDEFLIESVVGKGTEIRITKWKRVP